MSRVSQEDQQCAVFIQNLREGVTLEHLYVEFKKYGKVKNVIFVKSKLQATVIFEKDFEAKEAIRMGNHSQILSKEIIVTKVYATDELAQKKNHNLFIKNVPEDLESKLLQNYLATEFGDVISLFLKKNGAGQNKGYGYVQFDSSASYDKILRYQSQQDQEQITIPNSEMSFTVEPFGRPTNTMNKAKIMGFFESLVPKAEQAEKEAKVKKVLDEILEKSKNLELVPSEVNMKFFFEYKESKENFWASIEFQAQNEEIEEIVQLLIKEHIRLNFGTTPEITFKGTFSNERNIIVQGLKDHVNNKVIVEWLAKNLDIQLLEANIRIFTPRPRDNGQRRVANQCLISFDTREQGKNLMIYAAQRINKEIVSEITEDLHKITINMSRNEVKEIRKHQKKMKDLYNPVIVKQTVDEVIPPAVMFNPFFQANRPGPRQLPPFPFPQGNMPFPMQMMSHMMPYSQINPNSYPIHHVPAQVHVPLAPAAPVNVFAQYQSLSQEEKARQVNNIAGLLQTQKGDFLKLKQEDQTKVLGQIIYYKINNFDKIQNPQSIGVFKDQSLEQILNQLNHYKSEAAKITPMLIDTEVLETDEIIEIISDENELLERCKEAIELLQSNADSNPTPQ